MKLLIILLFTVFFTIESIAQTSFWHPAPFESTSIYLSQKSNLIIPVKADSVELDSNSLHHLMWRKNLNLPYATCDSGLLSENAFFSNYSYLPFYSIRTDSAFHIELSAEEEKVFHLPLITDSLAILAFDSFLFAQVDSFSTMSLLGELDSVVVFKLTDSIGNSLDLPIILSKNYGLVQFPNLRELTGELFDPSKTYDSYELVGLSTADTQMGLSIPQMDYYSAPEPGDKFVYYMQFSGLSIPPNVLESPCYGYMMIEYIGNQGNMTPDITFYNEALVKTPIGCETSLSGFMESIIFDSNALYSTGNLIDGNYHATELRLTNGEFRLSHNYFFAFCDTTNGFHLGFDGSVFRSRYIKDFGTQYKEASFGNGFYRLTLKAAVTSKGDYDFWPIELSVEEAVENEIRVFPNPSQSGIFSVESSDISNLMVTDIVGKQFQLPVRSTIDLSSFPSGVYFLHIESEGELIIVKLVKQ